METNDTQTQETIKAYKGFDKDLKCRGFQYEVGKEYEIDGDIECCERGFHACENPFAVWDYYFLNEKAQIQRFCEVEQSGKIKKDNNKQASSRIKIKAEFKLADYIKLAIEWIEEKTIKNMDEASTNDNGSYSAKIGSPGDYAKIGSPGDYAKIGSSGYSAQIGSSGYSAQIGSSGDSAQIGSSGDSAKIGSPGDYAKIGSSGDSAQIESTGEDSVICCAGHQSKVKAKKGSWITLAEWRKDEKKGRWVPAYVKTEYVDDEHIKADTWYTLKDGQFIEVND